MSNHRPAGTVPAALSRTGQDVPPSPEVQQQALAQVIGQAVAFHVAQLLGPVLQRLVDVQEHYACLVCTTRVKHELNIAVANAKAAGEPEPVVKASAIRQAFTDGCRGPVCWECFDPDKDSIEPERVRTLNEERAAHGLPPIEFPQAAAWIRDPRSPGLTLPDGD